MNIMTDDDERRRLTRPQPPKPGLIRSLILYTDRLAKKIFQTWFGISTLIFVLLISVLVIIWSLNTRLPLLNDSLLKIKQKENLQLQLYTLKSQWSDEDLKTIEKNISKEKSKVFHSFTALATWLSEKSTYASSLGLIMDYVINEQKKTNLNNIYSISIAISLKIKHERADSVYVRGLQFIKNLIEDNLHLEVSESAFKSDGNGVNEININVNVWVRDEKKMININDTNPEENVDENADIPSPQQ